MSKNRRHKGVGRGYVQQSAEGGQRARETGLTLEDARKMDEFVQVGDRTHYSPTGLSPEEMKRAAEDGTLFDMVRNLNIKAQQGKSNKRQPLLADRFMAMKIAKEVDWNQRKYVNLVREYLPQAKRFVFSEEAVRHAGNVVQKIPEAIAYAQEFAIPVHKIMYIEFPSLPYWMMLNPNGKADSDMDVRLGYLFIGPTVYVLSETAGYSNPAMVPMRYNLWQPHTESESSQMLIEKMKHKEIIDPNTGVIYTDVEHPLDIFFWGSSFGRIATPLRSALREYHSMTPLVPEISLGQFWEQLYSGAAGDLRNIIAFLLLLNQPSAIRYEEEVPHHRAMIHAKPSVFLSHSRVTLHIDPVPQLRKIMKAGKAAGGFKRWHPVRGHFCHDKTARYYHTFPKEKQADYQHMAEWQEYDVNKWKCLKCGGARWWRECPKGRGRKDLGMVHTEYEVRA